MQIAYLSSFAAPEGPPIHRRLHEIASGVGTTFRWLKNRAPGQGGAQWAAERNELFAEADALFLSGSGNLILYDDEYWPVIDGYVDSGKPLIVEFSENALDRYNAFLQRYDFAGTTFRLSRRNSGMPERVVRFTRSERSFHDTGLFKGIDEVIVQQPNHIAYASDCQAMLTGADPLDFTAAESDLRKPGYLVATPTPMVVNDAIDTRFVMGIFGGCLHDPYTGPFGHSFPGIEPNVRFAQNLLRMMQSARQSVSDLSNIGKSLLDEIEHALLEFVSGVGGVEWWSPAFIPQDILDGCANRAEGSTTVPFAFLDFIHYKKIIKKNWPLFEPFLAAVMGQATGSNKAVAWIQAINDRYRKFAAHKTRSVVTGFSFSQPDIETLREYRDRARALRRAASRKKI